MFNRIQFLNDLLESIDKEQPDDLWSFIYEQIDNECIYYSDSAEIVKQLGYYNWEDEVITNISQAAYKALEELVCDNWEMFKEYETE